MAGAIMAGATRKVWYSFDVVVATCAREAVEYALMEAGALGTETVDKSVEQACVSGYFDHPPDPAHLRATLEDSLRIYRFESSSLFESRVRQVENRDWLEEWKRDWQPIEVGDKMIVAPPWSEIPDAAGRVVIRIEPGMAFGTGTHETTRLCLQAIEKHFDGRSFLDIGTGTGILAIAAALLHPAARIEACDTDDEALGIARENARLNGVGDRISFRVGTVEACQAVRAAFVCANLTAEVIDTILPALVDGVDLNSSRLVLSGLLGIQADKLVSRLQSLGIARPLEVLQDGEWVAIIA